jgi:transcriptional regulator with XRE-family HTH domain
MLIGVIHSRVSERDVGLPGGSRLGQAWVIMSGEAGNTHTELEIGRTLRLTREKRGLSLQQVEEATKIRSRYLRDLENENFDVLPAVYMLGSLKTYAGNLGLDGAAMAAELKRRQRLPQAEQDEAREMPPAREPRGFLESLGSLFGIETAEDEAGMVAGPVRSTGLYMGLAVVLIVVFATYLAPSFGKEGRPSVAQVREPKISHSPSMLARASDVLVDEPYNEGGNVDYQSERQAHTRTRETETDDRTQAIAGIRVTRPPETAQAPPSPATSFESEPASAPAKAPASAPPPSTISAPAPERNTPAPTRIRTEPVAQEVPDDEGGEVAAAPATPPARVSGSPRTHERPADAVDALRLGKGIYSQGPQLGREVQRIRIVTSREASQSSSVQEQQLYQP